MTDTAIKLADRLEQEGKKTVEFIEGIPADLFDQQVYEDGTAWTVRQVCIHLVEAEGSIPRLAKNVLAGGQGVSEDFDLDRYNESRVRKMGRLSREEIISQFAELRKKNVKMVSELDEKELITKGIHPFLGGATIAEMMRMMYMNVKIHIRDIQRVLGEI